jgi:hypothetical protein
MPCVWRSTEADRLPLLRVLRPTRAYLDLETRVRKGEHAVALLLVVGLPALPAARGNPEAMDQDDRVGVHRFSQCCSSKASRSAPSYSMCVGAPSLRGLLQKLLQKFHVTTSSSACCCCAQRSRRCNRGGRCHASTRTFISGLQTACPSSLILRGAVKARNAASKHNPLTQLWQPSEASG